MEILPQLLVNAAISGSIYVLVSLGLCLAYGLLKILNFAHGQFLTFGAYIYFAVSIGGFAGNSELVPETISLLAVCAAMIVLSQIAISIFIFPLLSFSPLLPFVSTIAFGTIIEMVISMVFGVNVKSLSYELGGESIAIGSALITPTQIVVIGTAVVTMLIVGFTVHVSSLGRKIRCLSHNPDAAQAIGINKKKISLIVFSVSAVIAGYAGVLVGLTTNVQPTMGSAYTIKAFAAMVLGGLGNVWGTVIGSYLLALIENLSLGIEIDHIALFGYDFNVSDISIWGMHVDRLSLPSGYKDAFSYAIILLMLLVKPSGLFSFRKRTA